MAWMRQISNNHEANQPGQHESDDTHFTMLTHLSPKLSLFFTAETVEGPYFVLLTQIGSACSA